MLNSLRTQAGVACLAAMLAGCVSTTFPPQTAGDCDVDPRLPGVWSTGFVTSQIGPSRWTLSLSCDCKFRQSGFLLVVPAPMRTRGRYNARDGVLNLEGCCTSTYHFENEILVVQEEGGDTFRYHRTKSFSCSQSRAVENVEANRSVPYSLSHDKRSGCSFTP
jgi:hypothetical protein